MAMLPEDRANSDIAALYRAAVDHQRHGRADAAAALCRDIVDAAPDHALAHNLLGVIAAAAGATGDAVACFQRAVTADPSHPELLMNLANALRIDGRTDDAIASLCRVVALRPDDGEACRRLGDAFAEAGQVEPAAAALARAVELLPDDADAVIALAHLERRLDRNQFALAHYRRALELRGDDARLRFDLGHAQRGAGDLEGAAASFRHAIAREPAYAPAHNSLGNALYALNDNAGAEAAFRQAIALDGALAQAHKNLGTGLYDEQRPDEALECFHRAVAADPDFDEGRFGIATTLLLQGEFATGWRYYEARLTRRNAARRAAMFTMPRWQGEPLAGKSIVVDAEQGLGDTIQFARYLPLLAAAGATVSVLVNPALVGLLQSLDGHVRVMTHDAAPPAADFYVPLMSLPLAVGTTAETISAAAPYLAPPADLAAHWQQRLASSGVLSVGLAWAGSERHALDRFRSITPARWRGRSG